MPGRSNYHTPMAVFREVSVCFLWPMREIFGCRQGFRPLDAKVCQCQSSTGIDNVGGGTLNYLFGPCLEPRSDDMLFVCGNTLGDLRKSYIVYHESLLLS